MAKDFMGCRLGKADKDIQDDLARFSDKTARLKQVYRLAMAVERGEYVRVSALGTVQVTKEEPRPAKLEPLTWKFPEPAKPAKPAKKPAGDVKATIKSNMLQDF